MNIDPTMWGPSAWKFMHYITFGYPDTPDDEVKKNVFNFFNSLRYLLPCEKCRYNFNYHLTKHPLTNTILSSKSELIKWLINIHNDVNIANGKPAMTYQQVFDMYMVKKDEKNWLDFDLRMVSIIISFILLVLLLLVKYRG